jgi:hypothetical protein
MNIKKAWEIWRKSPIDVEDVKNDFVEACTPAACHNVLMELETCNQLISTYESQLNAMNLLMDEKRERISNLERDTAFLQSCVNSGETATKADRPSEKVKILLTNT